MGTADDNGNPGEWLDAVRFADPWIVTAAHSGDARAMRCVAHRIRYVAGVVFLRPGKAAGADPAAGTALPGWVAPGRVNGEVVVLESARWFAAAPGRPISSRHAISQYPKHALMCEGER